MRITHTQGRGINGRSFDYALEPLVLIVGRNDEGKTTILQSIRLAAIGYVPEVGKQNQETWKAFGGPGGLEVLNKYDTGAMSKRVFTLAGTTVSRQNEGIDLEDVPLLRADDYFRMTESERINYVFRKIKMPTQFTVDGIIAELRNISFDENTEATEKAKAAIIKQCETEFRAEGVSIAAALANVTAEGGVLKTEFTFWNRKQKDTIGAVRTLTELKLREPECSAESIASVDTQIREKQGELEKVNERRGALASQKEAAEKVQARRTEITNDLAVPAPNISEIPWLEAQIEAHRKVYNKPVEGVPVSTMPEEKLLESKREELCAAMDGMKPLRDANTTACSTVLQITSAIADLQKQKKCPYCETASKNWKSKAKKNLEALLKPAKKLAKEKSDALDAAINIEDALQKQCAAIDAAIKRRQTATEKITTIDAEIKELRAAFARHTARKAELEKELSMLQTIAAPEQKDIDAAEAERGKLSEDILALTGKRQGLESLQQDLKRAAQAEQEHQEAVARCAAIKVIGAMLLDKKSSMVNVAFESLLATANKIAAGLLKTPVAIHEQVIGRWEGAKFIPHKAFGGMAKAVTYLSIAAALSSQSELKVALLDELSRLDAFNKEQMKTNLAEAVRSGVLEQAICVDTSVELPVDGWQIITVGQ